MACGCGTCTNCKRKGCKIPKRKNAGGYLIGPSHEDGGILASFEHSGEMIELEGGEYIINAQTVQAVGVDFLDQLNSTATTHHEGGYNVGELPSPSNYEKGGKLPIKKYDEGGTYQYTPPSFADMFDVGSKMKLFGGGNKPASERAKLRHERKMARQGARQERKMDRQSGRQERRQDRINYRRYEK